MTEVIKEGTSKMCVVRELQQEVFKRLNSFRYTIIYRVNCVIEVVTKCLFTYITETNPQSS